MRRMPLQRFLVLLALVCACASDGSKHDADDDASEMDDDASQGPEEPGQKRSIPLFDAVRLSSIDKDPHFQSAEKEFDFGAGPFAKVTFVVDLATTCFPVSQWQKDPPPMGQNYSPSCDAFDRNFEFTLDEPKKDGDAPAFEIIRAITPFGGPLHMETDLTDLANAHPGKHTVKTFIATWSDAMGKVSGSKGGWNVSAHIELETGKAPAKVLAAVPLFNGSLDPKKLRFDAPFTLPVGTKKMRIDLRATGHGQGTDPLCFGPAEEFCDRPHRVSIDDKMLPTLSLYRDDCAKLCTHVTDDQLGEHCKENPFGLIESVEAPRAGWCPGSLVDPHSFEFPATGGSKAHTFSYWLEQIAEGGSIRASAVLYAYGE
jgi:hypothetical protein